MNQWHMEEKKYTNAPNGIKIKFTIYSKGVREQTMEKTFRSSDQLYGFLEIRA